MNEELDPELLAEYEARYLRMTNRTVKQVARDQEGDFFVAQGEPGARFLLAKLESEEFDHAAEQVSSLLPSFGPEVAPLLVEHLSRFRNAEFTPPAGPRPALMAVRWSLESHGPEPWSRWLPTLESWARVFFMSDDQDTRHSAVDLAYKARKLMDQESQEFYRSAWSS